MARTIARPLCASPRCRIRDRHKPGCGEDACGGCLPRTSAFGLALCEPCTDGIITSAKLCVRVHEELGRQLAATPTQGEKTSGSPTHDAPFNDLAADMRTHIRQSLADVALLIYRGRGIRARSDKVVDLAAFIIGSHRWLAAHPSAGDIATDLFHLGRGRAFAVAYPSGARSFKIPDARCPGKVADGDCPGGLWTLVRDADSALPSELACDGDEIHRYPAADWRSLFKTLRQHAGMETT